MYSRGVKEKYPLDFKFVWLALTDSLNILWNISSQTLLLKIECSTDFNLAMASDVCIVYTYIHIYDQLADSF